MPTPPDDPLRKVTLNLYAADCEWLEHQYGRGWTERIRQHIHALVHDRSQPPDTSYHKARRTLGDLG
jgi:hypothetical protein